MNMFVTELCGNVVRPIGHLSIPRRCLVILDSRSLWTLNKKRISPLNTDENTRTNQAAYKISYRNFLLSSSCPHRERTSPARLQSSGFGFGARLGTRIAVVLCTDFLPFCPAPSSSAHYSLPPPPDSNSSQLSDTAKPGV